MNLEQYIPRMFMTRARRAMWRLTHPLSDDATRLMPCVTPSEMFDRIERFDWSRTSLGACQAWPSELHTSVSLVLCASVPMCLLWGPTRILIYNDSFVPLLANQHPRALGQPLAQLPALSLFEEGWRGEHSVVEDRCVLTARSGKLEEMFVSYTLNPIRSAEGRTSGLLLSAIETTSRVISDRRARTLLEVSASCLEASDAQEVLRRAAAALARNSRDVAFALFYWLDSSDAQLVAQTGMESGSAACPSRFAIGDTSQAWPMSAVLASPRGVLLEDIQSRFPGLVAGAYRAAISRARLHPLAIDASGAARAVLITGLSPRSPAVDDCPIFHELLAVTVSNMLGAMLAQEAQRERVRTLAELDRAKTDFLTNISHELRTPLTLIVGPLEDELAQSSSEATRRGRLELAYRNTLRLLKLVQALLDFARFDAGRAQPSFQSIDLARDTAALAESFRPAFERVGLSLTVDCAPLDQTVALDREMWEKAVFNLLSNAVKYTWQGGVRVSVRALADHVELEVSDTGIGIAADDLPHVFERFQRIHGAHGRSHDGAGIGLSLVRDIVRLHGGEVEVASEQGHGSRFIARLPVERSPQPLAADVPEALPMNKRSTAVRDVYIEDAMGGALTGGTRPSTPAGDRERVLWVDDHPDLREYVRALLSEHWDVVAVGSAAEAVASARSRRPDLVLSDVMLPELNGLSLLRALRADPQTRDVPVIMLSARPGEDLLLGDLELGAEDYLLKPFAARELVTRVRTHLQLARARRALTAELEGVIEARTRELAEAGERLQLSLTEATAARLDLERTIEERKKAADELRDSEQKLQQLSAALQEASAITDAESGAVLYVSPAYERIWGRSCESLYAAPSSWLEAIVPEERDRVEQAFARTRESGARCEEEFRIRLPDGTLRWIRARAFPIYDEGGRLARVASAGEDITERKTNELARESLEWQLRQSQKLEALGTLTGGIAHDFNNLLSAILGNCELIKQELVHVPLQPPIGESLDEICTAGTRAKDLVQRLLSFGRPKQQQPRAVDLQPILTDVVKLLRATLPAGVELTLQCGAVLPRVRADETLIHQVVLNLATNAWQALEGRPGRVQIALAACEVDAAMAAAHPGLVLGPHIQLSVRDNGSGIEAEHLDRLFEPFFTTKAPDAGTGLGLSVVHGIVHSLGGCISVESKRNVGSTFHVYLPASKEVAHAPSALRAGAQTSFGRGEQLLFVDDEPALARLAVAQLQRMGYRVEAYTQPLAALEAFQAQPGRYDLVITDYNMPQMSGIDLGEQILRLRPDTEIVLVSGHMRNSELERAYSCGIREVISKPFLFDELREVVRRRLAAAKSS